MQDLTWSHVRSRRAAEPLKKTKIQRTGITKTTIARKYFRSSHTKSQTTGRTDPFCCRSKIAVKTDQCTNQMPAEADQCTNQITAEVDLCTNQITVEADQCTNFDSRFEKYQKRFFDYTQTGMISRFLP